MKCARLVYSALRVLRAPFGSGDRVRARRKGINWELDLREGIDLTIYLTGAFERSTLRSLERLVRPGETVIDIGANVGAHTLHLARLVGPTGRVIAFEPTDYAVEKLRANLRANPLLASRVEVHQAFLTAQPEQPMTDALASSWPVDGTRPDDPLLAGSTKSLLGAVATTVDLAMRAAGSPRIGLIKLDVDGHELGVLEGARASLERWRPPIVMELAPYVFDPATRFDAMVRLLVALGYRFSTIGSGRALPSDPGELRNLIHPSGSINVTAAPAPR